MILIYPSDRTLSDTQSQSHLAALSDSLSP
jgi:hypothetical protein